MRYHVTLDADANAPPTVVDVVDLPDGRLDVRVDGHAVDVDLAVLDSWLSVRVDGVVVDLAADGQPPEMNVVAWGHDWRVRVESERTQAAVRAGASRGGAGDKVVRSPMPGRVVKVLVAAGDAVQAGQGVAVIEAMKMENEVRARSAGVVASVHVAPGAAVEGHAPLVTLA